MIAGKGDLNVCSDTR